MEWLVFPELDDVAGARVGVSCPVDPTAASLGRCRVTRGRGWHGGGDPDLARVGSVCLGGR
jgi:hypothetical protein